MMLVAAKWREFTARGQDEEEEEEEEVAEEEEPEPEPVQVSDMRKSTSANRGSLDEFTRLLLGRKWHGSSSSSWSLFEIRSVKE